MRIFEGFPEEIDVTDLGLDLRVDPEDPLWKIIHITDRPGGALTISWNEATGDVHVSATRADGSTITSIRQSCAGLRLSWTKDLRYAVAICGEYRGVSSGTMIFLGESLVWEDVINRTE